MTQRTIGTRDCKLSILSLSVCVPWGEPPYLGALKGGINYELLRAGAQIKYNLSLFEPQTATMKYKASTPKFIASWHCHSWVFRMQIADNTPRSSRAVPHPSTNRALCRLTSEVRRDPVYSTWYGRRRTVGINHIMEIDGLIGFPAHQQ